MYSRLNTIRNNATVSFGLLPAQGKPWPKSKSVNVPTEPAFYNSRRDHVSKASHYACGLPGQRTSSRSRINPNVPVLRQPGSGQVPTHNNEAVPVRTVMVLFRTWSKFRQ
jgi:hypothetical protein